MSAYACPQNLRGDRELYHKPNSKFCKAERAIKAKLLNDLNI
jgi:hypothetical protein